MVIYVVSVNGQVITKVSAANAKDVDAAVEAARKAYKTSWGLKCAGYERGRLLSKLADLMEANIDEIAALEALDGGTCCLMHGVFDGKSHIFHAKANTSTTPNSSIFLGRSG